jgi:5-methylcytosine-specific restriction endonuclease McrA
VFERDNYRCRICGTTTDENLPRYHPRRPELGHINAIAAGGTHTWDNVCCLCFACNRADGVNQLPVQTSILDQA